LATFINQLDYNEEENEAYHRVLTQEVEHPAHQLSPTNEEAELQ
jgi:hypothetical protein